MELPYNKLYAISEDKEILAEFSEWEDVGKFTSEKEFKIVLYNEIANVGFIVPDEELAPFRK